VSRSTATAPREVWCSESRADGAGPIATTQGAAQGDRGAADRTVVKALLLLLLALPPLAVAAYQAAGKARRRRELFQFALRFGLDYSPTDPVGLIDHTFDLFNLGDGARCENVVSGKWNGVPVNAGELRFAPTSRGVRNGHTASTKMFSFAFTEVTAWLPHITIRHHSLGGLAEDLGLRRLRFESEAFNRRFAVDCEDREFAYKFVDIRMLQWLLGTAAATHSSFGFEARGSRLLVHCPRVAPNELVPLLGLAQGFHDHIPRMVLRQYAPDAPIV
jgi:hypothetical protein